MEDLLLFRRLSDYLENGSWIICLYSRIQSALWCHGRKGRELNKLEWKVCIVRFNGNKMLDICCLPVFLKS